MIRFWFSSGLLAICVCSHQYFAGAQMAICRGMCDASAVMAIDGDRFAVADDEENVLRIYSRKIGGDPLQAFDLSSFLQVDGESPEVDLEGAALLGDRTYWISSHARNKNGKDRPSRRRFCATVLIESNGVPMIKPVGQPYQNLLTDLLNEPRLKPFNLAAASRRAPKSAAALNIEGLCATPEGHLLLGFRNPIPAGQALLVPLLNPAELIEGKAARFGAPRQLDLNGLGIRSLTRVGNRYFIIAGSYDGEGRSYLYEWAGGDAPPRKLSHPELAELNPEAIEALTENGVARLLVVSDDGTLKIGGKDCKDLKDPNMKYFRTTTIDL